RNLADKSVTAIHQLKSLPGDKVVAQKGAEPLWIHRSAGAAAWDLVAAELPQLAGGEYLFQYFEPANWASLFPLLQFLRELARESGWTPPPLRACFMFDDPNLHGRNYGYVRYPQLAEESRKHNYHASFATVPFDAWHVNQD